MIESTDEGRVEELVKRLRKRVDEMGSSPHPTPIEIEAGEVRTLRRKFDATKYDSEKRRALKDKLDRITNRYYFDENLRITGESGADVDEALRALCGFGADSYSSYRFGDY